MILGPGSHVGAILFGGSRRDRRGLSPRAQSETGEVIRALVAPPTARRSVFVTGFVTSDIDDPCTALEKSRSRPCVRGSDSRFFQGGIVTSQGVVSHGAWPLAYFIISSVGMIPQ
jgi:hypothetical protein